MSSITLSLSLRGRLLSGTQTTLQGTLFGNGEPGFTFEPWDITTLYQDRAGTTPVTAAGQSVGLRLDKSKGLALGPELVTNGDFATNSTANWTEAIMGGTLNASTGQLVVNNAAGSGNTGVYQVRSCTSGQYIRVSIEVLARTEARLAVFNGTLGTTIYSNNALPVGTSTFIVGPMLSGTFTVYAHCSAGNTATFDNISVKELPGNHQVAVNDAKRGVYGWMPKTGRRNLLTYTEQFDNAVWFKAANGGGVLPTVSANTGVDPDGNTTADLVTISRTTTSGLSFITQRLADDGTQKSRSFYVKAASAGDVGKVLDTWTFDTAVANRTAVTLSADWVRIVLPAVTLSAGASREQLAIGFLDNGSLSPSTGTVQFLIWGAQLELGSTATAYQRVNSQYDITEAGVPTCYYVQPDGVDDAYVTPTITPNTDKAQVFAGVRKLSDAATGVLFETSTTADSNTGAWYLALLSGGNWQPQTGPVGSRTYTPYFLGAAPKTSVLTVTIDNAVAGAGEIDLRENGQAKIGSAIFDGGATGNFLAYPAYIYSRGGTSLPFNGLDFGHAVRFGPNLDAATIARVESLIARNTPEVTL